MVQHELFARLVVFLSVGKMSMQSFFSLCFCVVSIMVCHVAYF